jgi:hypothetical protein
MGYQRFADVAVPVVLTSQGSSGEQRVAVIDLAHLRVSSTTGHD